MTRDSACTRREAIQRQRLRTRGARNALARSAEAGPDFAEFRSAPWHSTAHANCWLMRSCHDCSQPLARPSQSPAVSPRPCMSLTQHLVCAARVERILYSLVCLEKVQAVLAVQWRLVYPDPATQGPGRAQDASALTATANPTATAFSRGEHTKITLCSDPESARTQSQCSTRSPSSGARARAAGRGPQSGPSTPYFP